jgi:hypothetical protein
VWNGHVNRPYSLGAAYDPRARKADNTAPNTTAPVQRFAPGTAGSTVPIAIAWSGTDVGWGIEKFQLQRSVDGGTWTTVILPTPRTKTVTQQLAIGHTVRYRVRAKDAAGNWGSFDYGPTFKPRIRDDASLSITYSGDWSNPPDAMALGDTLHSSASAGASATSTLIGRDIAWVAARGPGRGTARVYVDGTLRATVSLDASTDLPHQNVFRIHWSSDGSHVIKVVVASGAVNLDAFVVLH